MSFIQPYQQHTDGFQNLLGILRSNRERDAADIAASHDNNIAIAKGGLKRLVDNGVIDEGDTIDGMKKATAQKLADASNAKAIDSAGAGKPLGDGFIASKLGEKGYAEQQTYADAGASEFDKKAKNAGIKFGNDGKAYQWDDAQKTYKAVDNDTADAAIKKADEWIRKEKYGGKSGLDAMRYAAQVDADKRTAATDGNPKAPKRDLSASANEADKTKKLMEKEGETLSLPAIDKKQMQRMDDMGAVIKAKQEIRDQAGDVNQVFTAASNESGNPQYNYARGKQYIEDTMPPGEARDAAIKRYSEMFMQQQLVGDKGAYMGNIYDDRNKTHSGTGGAKEKIAYISDGADKKKVQFNYTGYATPQEMNAARDRTPFLKAWATAFYGGDMKRIPEKMQKYSDPAMWDNRERNLFQSFDSDSLTTNMRDLPVFNQEKFALLRSRGMSEAEAHAAAMESPRARASQQDKDALK